MNDTTIKQALSKFTPPFHCDLRGEIFDSKNNSLATCYGNNPDEESFESDYIIGTAIADFLNQSIKGQPESICNKCGLRTDSTIPTIGDF